MRYWPKGVKKDRFDRWEQDLAPSATLLKATRAAADRVPDQDAEAR